MKEFWITILSLSIGFLIGYIVNKLVLNRRSNYYEVKRINELEKNQTELRDRFTDVSNSNSVYLERLHRKREDWKRDHRIDGKTE